jgi:CHAD domain-containing protein
MYDKGKGVLMAYAFERGGTIPDDVKRIATELIDTILSQLKDERNNRDEAIYESRKAFKQLRAILRLMRTEIGEKFYKSTNQFYSNLAGELAPLRDAYIVIEALDKLIGEIEDQQVLKTAKSIRKDLNKRYKAVKLDLLKADGAVQKVIVALEKHRPTIAAWPLKRKKFKTFRHDLEITYEEGQKQRRLVSKKDSPEAYHNWRKAVKNLWYQVRLFELAQPEKLGDYAKDLKTLSDYLGNANDLAVLETFLAEHGDMQGEAGQAFLATLSAKQKALKASARRLGKKLYEEKSQKFVKEINASWKKWKAATP